MAQEALRQGIIERAADKNLQILDLLQAKAANNSA
jgi:hypothetical protein